MKYQIEAMRGRPEIAGYVITELTDINWEVNGLLDFARNPKVYHHRLCALQQQDMLIPRPARYSSMSISSDSSLTSPSARGKYVFS